MKTLQQKADDILLAWRKGEPLDDLIAELDNPHAEEERILRINRLIQTLIDDDKALLEQIEEWSDNLPDEPKTLTDFWKRLDECPMLAA